MLSFTQYTNKNNKTRPFLACSNTTPCIEILDIRYDKLHCSKILQVSHMPHGYLSDRHRFCISLANGRSRL